MNFFHAYILGYAISFLCLTFLFYGQVKGIHKKDKLYSVVEDIGHITRDYRPMLFLIIAIISIGSWIIAIMLLKIIFINRNNQ